MARILVVEDDPNHGAFVIAALERSGHACTLVSNGQQALRAIADGHDLVVSDVFMPDLDGIEMMREFRQRGCGVPVVAMSGGLRDRLSIFLNTMRAFGAVACLAKPFGHDELDAAVRFALQGDRAAGRPGAA